MIYLTEQRRAALIALNALDDAASMRWLGPDPVVVGSLSHPSGLALDGLGSIVIADSGNNRVLVLDPATNASTVYDSSGSAAGPLRRPTGAAITAAGGLAITDTGNHRLVFAGPPDAPSWSSYGSPGYTGAGCFAEPAGIFVDGAGRILVADPGAGRLARIDAPDGSGWTELPLPAGPKTPRPYALAAGPQGGVLVSDVGNARVLLLAADDTLSILIEGAADGSLFAPSALAALGADILIADAGGARVTRWAVSPDSGAWIQVEKLDGRVPPWSGYEFTSLIGLAAG